MKSFCTISCLVISIILSVSAQTNKSEVRSLIMHGNNIQTIVYNNGSISGPGVTGNVLDFVWHGLGYAYEIGLLAGAKVPLAYSSDSVTIVSEGFGVSNSSTADGDFAPDGITKWGFVPLSGYAKDGQMEIANNQNPQTWQNSWNQWPGRNGSAIADLEAYYAFDDRSNAEFAYYPFPSDSLMRGLGLFVEGRFYQFIHPNLEDVFLSTFDIKNVSEKNLPDMVLGIFGDPHIGGSNNYSDDATNIDTARNLIYSWDPDNMSDKPSFPPGYFGTRFVETPDNKGLTSYASLVFGGYNRPKNDSLMFYHLRPGHYTNELFYPPTNNLGDFVMILGSGFTTLNTMTSTTLGAAYILADDLEGLKSKSDYIDQTYAVLFKPKGAPIAITSPVQGNTVQSNTLQIQWTTTELNGDSTISLYYSNTVNSKWWNEIAVNIPNSGSYTWDVSNIADGIFYKIYIVNRTGNTVSFDSSKGFFILNKPGDVPPEIALFHPVANRYTNIIPITWIAGDADGDAIVVNIYFSNDNGTSYSLIAQSSNTGSFLFDSRIVANTPIGKIKIEAIANGKSGFLESPSFHIVNFYTAITDSSSLRHHSGSATGGVFPGIADSSQLTGHVYMVSFDSVNGALAYSLHDSTSNQTKIDQEPLNTITGSGKIIDGMRLWFQNDEIGIDSSRSSFIVPIESISATVKRPSIGLFRLAPVDIVVQFGSMDTTSTGEYAFPLDSAGSNSPNIKTVKIPFKVSIINDTTEVQLVIRNNLTYGKKNRWDFGEEIIILTPPPYRITSSNTHVGIIFNPAFSQPIQIPAGTQFIARTTKPFTPSDVYTFISESKYARPTGTSFDPALPQSFLLEQNYPNPFNPVTTIRFSIPTGATTRLAIYDIMGREIALLKDEFTMAGKYQIEWDGRNKEGTSVSSGIYFYRLQSGSSVITKKMIFMK